MNKTKYYIHDTTKVVDGVTFIDEVSKRLYDLNLKKCKSNKRHFVVQNREFNDGLMKILVILT